MRVVEIGPERLARWVAGFGERHDGVETHDDAGRIVALTGGDGARAEMAWFSHDPIGVVLVRRGGYAVGLAVGGRFTESKVGARHVQSRTAAGGWSQQRFARRRGNQADALVEAVTVHTVRILLGGNESPRAGAPGIPAALVLGGDRTLAADVFAARSLRALVGLPRREFYDLPDPKRDVLERALDRGRSVRITLTEPAPRDR